MQRPPVCFWCDLKHLTLNSAIKSHAGQVTVISLTTLHKEDWEPKKRCFRTAVLAKTLQRPLDSKEIKPVNPKGNQSWIFIGRTDVEPEAPILWPPDAKSWLTGKDPDARKDWGQEKKGTTEDEMVGWHHWLNGHEFEQTLVDSEGLGSLAYCSPQGRKESETTELLNNNHHPLLSPQQSRGHSQVKQHCPQAFTC